MQWFLHSYWHKFYRKNAPFCPLNLSQSCPSAEGCVVRGTGSSRRTTCACPQLCGVRTVRCGPSPSNGASARSSGLSLVDRRAVRIAVRLRRPSVCHGHLLSARHRCRSAGRTQLAQLWPPVVRPGGADSGCVRTGGVRRPLCPHCLRRRPNADTAAARAAAAVQCSVPPPHRLCRCHRAGIKVVQ